MSFLLASFLFLAAFPATAQIQTPQAPHAYVLQLHGVITPASQDLIRRHIQSAAESDADIFVLELHTPGGLYESTRDIVQTILDSPVPVATYVTPAGSHAASAGTFILYASHIAAMAPGTNLGAATPVQMGGHESADAKDTPDSAQLSGIDRKMVNDAAAYIRGLAALRNRNAQWAESAVRTADSLTEKEALAQRAIDIVAVDTKTLLQKIDGRKVSMAGGRTHTLKTAQATIETHKPDFRHHVLDIITHPNVAFLLMTLGMYGMIYEFANPGVLLPGIVGGICLLLGLYALNILPVNASGALLLLFGIALMTAEAFTPAFGILGIGGLIAFIFGATMLLDGSINGFGIDLWLIAGVGFIGFLSLSIALGLLVQSRRAKPVTGKAELLHGTGHVIAWNGTSGEIRITGEVWQAVSAMPLSLDVGAAVRVTGIDGLILTITPKKD